MPPAKRLRNAPLVHVLAQVVFPPMPRWADRLDALRAALYDVGFPRYMPVHTSEVKVGLTAQGSTPSVEHRTAMYAQFVDKDERLAFQCSESSFVLHSTGYQTFQHFVGHMERGLVALQATMPVSVVDRLGLRYVDLVQIRAGENFGQYVHAGLLGFPFKEAPELGASKVGFTTQSIGMTPLGALAIRSAVMAPGQFSSPDVDVAGLRPPAHVDPKRPSLLVDFDHFSLFTGPTAAAPMDFAVSAVLAHFDALHSTAKAAFEAIVTPHAIAEWGGWEEIAE